MPEICRDKHCTNGATTLHHLLMAIPQVGVDILGPFSLAPGQVKLLYQVDRGRAHGHDIGGKDQTFLLEEDNMSFQPPDQDSVQQQDIVCIPIDNEFLRPTKDKTAIHVDRALPIERISRGCEQGHLDRVVKTS
ncbi:hypothetical protein CR513_32024, partial [Mucuna pruriens]